MTSFLDYWSERRVLVYRPSLYLKVHQIRQQIINFHFFEFVRIRYWLSSKLFLNKSKEINKQDLLWLIEKFIKFLKIKFGLGSGSGPGPGPGPEPGPGPGPEP